MNAKHPTLVPLPEDLDDEAVAKLLDFLHDLAHALEDHYAGQLLRYHHRPDPRQRALWLDEDQPPF